MLLNITSLDAVLHMIGGQFVKGNYTDIKETVQHFGKHWDLDEELYTSLLSVRSQLA